MSDLDVSNHTRRINGFTVRCRLTANDPRVGGRASYDIRVCKAGKVVLTTSYQSPVFLTEAIDKPSVITDLCQRAADEALS